jgi:hypothetical protein
MITFSAAGLEARPLQFAYNDAAQLSEVAWKANIIVRRCAAHEAFFSDYIRGCAGACKGVCKDASPQCNEAKAAVVHTLMKPDSLLWEVWDGIDLVGILRLSEVVPKCNAKAHYFFFDGKMRDRTPLLQAWKQWAFKEAGLHRVTIEVPAYAKALAMHAHKYLGFGGQFRQGRFTVEGVLKDAIKWRSKWHDIYIMGCIDG